MRGLLSVTLFLTGTPPHTEDDSGPIGFAVWKFRYELLGRKQQRSETWFGGGGGDVVWGWWQRQACPLQKWKRSGHTLRGNWSWRAGCGLGDGRVEWMGFQQVRKEGRGKGRRLLKSLAGATHCAEQLACISVPDPPSPPARTSSPLCR